MSKDVEVFESLKEPMAMGQVFAESGLFPDIKSQAQAVVKVLAGRELGISPLESMNSFFFVNNKIAMPSKLMGALIKRSKKYDYVVDKLDETECSITFYEKNGEAKKLGTSTFTFKDGAKAGLVNKDVWKSYPKNMLFARALSNGVRWYCPDVTCGYYTVEEVEDLQTVPLSARITFTDEGVENVETPVSK